MKNHIYSLLSLVFVTAIGCAALFPVKTDSVTNPGHKVTRVQLAAEAKGEAAKFEAADADLTAKEVARDTLISIAKNIAGKFVPADYQELLSTGLALVATGTTVDNVLTRRRHKKAKTASQTEAT
jgi:hypothetical protein